MARLPARLGLLFTLAVIALLVWRVLLPPVALDGDSGRYVAMGLNLLQHGVLSGTWDYSPAQAPVPGLPLGGPLTGFEIALSALHPPTHAQYTCLLAGIAAAGCTGSAFAIKLLYTIEIGVFLMAVYRIGLRLGLAPLTAWAAVFATILCREVWRYTGFVLSEPLFMMTLGLFLWSWLAAWMAPPRRLLWLAAGVALALCMLVKPAWNGLLPLLLLMLGWSAWRQPAQRKVFIVGMIMLCLGYGLLAGPYLLRNGLVLGKWTLSDSFYLITSLSHRMAFNMMSWSDWLAGWFSYLPDFGDTLSRQLFGPAANHRLGWDSGSYYIHGRDVLHVELLPLDHKVALQRLLNEYLLADPLKNAAVTTLLAWRGLFVGGKWGLFAVLLAWPVVRHLLSPAQRRLWFLLLLPGLGILFLNAQVSVSLPRYNLALIPVYAIVLALALQGLVTVARRMLARART